MDVNLLTRLKTAGGQGVLPAHATLAERNALALHLIALRGAGHAVIADEVMNCREVNGMISVSHYLSCQHQKCKRRTV